MSKLLLSTIAALTLVCATSAQAQVQQPFKNPAHFQLGDYGRFHGYLSQPVFCGIAKCGDNWMASPTRAKPAKRRQVIR
jgi:hypothetical protein